MPFHDRQVKRIPSRQAQAPQHDALCPFEIGQLNREDLVGDSEDGIEGGLDRVAPADGDVPMEDLLKHFRIRDEPLRPGKTPFQHLLGILFVRVWRPDQVHRDVRIEEDHRGGESR
jgi:hypothetical protein